MLIKKINILISCGMVVFISSCASPKEYTSLKSLITFTDPKTYSPEMADDIWKSYSINQKKIL